MLHERCVHIVDDEAKVRDALGLLLSTAQIELKPYGSAEEYLTLNPLEEPACVLLDNQLPGMSGIELLRRIVAATGKSSVIMITAYGDVPTAVLAMKAGAFDFVQKPFDAEALLASVEEALTLSDDGATLPMKSRNSRPGSRCSPSASERSSRCFWRDCRPSSSLTSWGSARGRPNTTGPPSFRRCGRTIFPTSCEWRSSRKMRTAANEPRNRRSARVEPSCALSWSGIVLSALQSERTASRMDDETFDYVIVGAGSAGCVLADRLTEDARSSVLVLEHGGSDRSIFIQMPAALSIPMNSRTYNWGYESEPEPHLGGRRIACPRGKVLGGSSSINGMVYVRGHPLDFERWEEEGAKGWGYRNVLPYFRRAESFAGAGRRLSRRRRTAHDRARAEIQPALRRLHRSGPAGGLCGQRRPERRASGGVRRPRHDGEGRRARVRRQRLS